MIPTSPWAWLYLYTPVGIKEWYGSWTKCMEWFWGKGE